MKKKIALALVGIMTLGLLAACGGGGTGESSTGGSANKEIFVVSREDGSGTRGAFTEIVGLMKDDVDQTTPDATIQNSTDGVLTTVAGDAQTVGYISLGSLNDKVKAVKVEGAEANAADVKDGSYKISRPFLLVYKDGISEAGQDLLDFAHSKQGQAVVAEHKYVEAVDNAPEYASKNLTGKVNIVGSTSVTPVMEAIAEEYKKLNPGVQVDITSNGSSAGIQSATEGSADIGMSSRELKDSEKSAVKETTIAIDGIAVIVNKENAVDDLTKDQIKGIFAGEIKDWSEVAK